MKSRILFCDFWEDPAINELSIETKLLGVYFWTNSRANLIGLYPISEKYISLETGVNKDLIPKIKIELEKIKRVYFYNYWVYLPNAQEICGYINEKKHGVAAQKELSKVPIEVLEHFRSLGYSIPYQYPIDTPKNQKPKPETKTYKQEKENIEPYNKKNETKENGYMTNEETDEMVKWAMKGID